MTKLEADIPMIIVKAEAAAGVAASGAVMQHLVEMSRRLGALEEAVKHPPGPETKLLK